MGLVILLVLSMTFSIDAIGQNNWGLGVRLGDPSGITLKKYMDKNALEVSVGRTHLFYGDKWYDKRFNKWYDGKKFGYQDFQYLAYKASTPIGIQVHYLFRKPLESASGLEWYFGVGGQLRYQTFTYDYRYKVNGNSQWYYATGDRVTDFDLGADGVLGLEYTFKEVPLSLFLDATLFMEVVDNPFLFSLQGGIGVRYNF